MFEATCYIVNLFFLINTDLCILLCEGTHLPLQVKCLAYSRPSLLKNCSVQS